MQITVKLFANFRQGRFKVREESYPESTAVADVIAALGLDLQEVGAIMINSCQTEPEHLLEEHDTLAIFPIIGGG